jgi:hypothetical protein
MFLRNDKGRRLDGESVGYRIGSSSHYPASNRRNYDNKDEEDEWNYDCKQGEGSKDIPKNIEEISELKHYH